MKKFITTLCALFTFLSSQMHAEIQPVWSTGVAVPGEAVILYLIETQEDPMKEPEFFEPAHPVLPNAQVRMMEWQAKPNPLDADRRMIAVQPIMIKADIAGQIAPAPIEVRYSSGRRVIVDVPPLPVVPTSEIKWYNFGATTYGVLWHTEEENSYVYQTIRAALKIFMPSHCTTPYLPQLNSESVYVSDLSSATDGVLGLFHGQIMRQNATAYAKGQHWNTADFYCSFTPTHEGRNTISGKLPICLAGENNSMDVPMPAPEISAIPLPDRAPADFTNAVGQYSIKATTTADNLAMNEAAVVEITVMGTGNLRQLECPKIQDEQNWLIIPPTRKPIPDINGRTIGMIYTLHMHPKAEVGSIPAFSFTYFSPEELTYKTATTAPIPMLWRETEATGSGIITAAAEPPPAGTVPVAELTDIYHFLPGEAAGGNGPELRLPRWLWYLLYLPGLSILGWMLLRKLLGAIAEGAESRAREKELAAIAEQKDSLGFLKSIGAFIECRIPTAEHTEALKNILNRRDTEAFAPGAAPDVSPSERARMLRAVRKVLAKLGALILLLPCLLPQAQAAEDAALEAYTAGRFSRALELLQAEQQSATPVRNSAELLYNMGNCYYRLGKNGHAALFYMRALHTDAGLPEARANLDFIRRKEGAVMPSAGLTDEIFTLLSIGQLWILTQVCAASLLLCVALMLLWRKQHKPLLQACTAGAAILCMLCAADWLYYATREVPDMESLAPADLACVTAATTARSAATDAASAIIDLPASTPLHLLAVRGTFSYVETFTGVRGWVHTADISPLAEGASSSGRPLIIRFD